MTAGGSASHPSFLVNPNMRVTIPEGSEGLFAMVEGPSEVPLNLKVVRGGERVTHIDPKDLIVSSGDYRHGFCYFDVPDLQHGDYTLVASTFDPGQLGPFLLTVRSAASFSTCVVPMEGERLHRKIIRGSWVLGSNAMGSGRNRTYCLNPTFLIRAAENTLLSIRLQSPVRPSPPLNVTVFSHVGLTGLGDELASSGAYTDWPQGVIVSKVAISAGDEVAAVFSSWRPVAAPFVAWVYSDRPVVLIAARGGGEGEGRSG
ncbi:hypothetical protein BDK51DRAFT_25789 [Blyttiomyces helicus]|uniref:Peptidase C2 calpain domain-containing protein n=1 Tax=Blyttiomyces helicus TaxID=388810 RepID=A0A4P9VZX8_9FUNG|nr:hypothetical protein BDK51DRAFT_25789 [Blyttiomyces helicus]|eukprot:RKO84595.1 hypothetical protein BDK51DRAFT_25789 [Blyttiomyces helicus]